jgi:hypothetical protein
MREELTKNKKKNEEKKLQKTLKGIYEVYRRHKNQFLLLLYLTRSDCVSAVEQECFKLEPTSPEVITIDLQKISDRT